MGSKCRIVDDILPIIQQRIEDYNIKTYIEPFCLSKDTIVFTSNGIKTIEELNIGDLILDENGNYTTVINKIKSKDGTGKLVKVKGNADFKATNKHIFYINGKETKVSELKEGDILDIGCSVNENTKAIDMINYITITNSPKKGRSGKLIGTDKIKLYHNAPITDRFIPISKELMRCYGLVVAEGDKSNVTMHKQEIEYLREFVNNYKNILGITENNKKYTIDENKNSCQLSVPYKTIYEKLFFQAMNVGYGARNKNISFLFSVSNDMCLEAIRYMYIGDGSCSEKGKYRSLNYKTSSKTLAYQLQALLSIKFGIKSTLSYGMNKERKIDGRVLKKSDYYNISVTRDEDIEFLTKQKNENIEIHESTNKFKITEIVEIEDEFYDITVDNESHKFIIAGGIVTHNCGGCNVIDKVICDKKIASDNHQYLIAMFKNLDKIHTLPEFITKEHYSEVRDCFNKGLTAFPDWYIGAVGFLASYNGRFFDGGYAGLVNTKAGTVRNYYDEAKRNLLEQIPRLQNIEFEHVDYTYYTDFEDCLFYLDPPYKGTKQYGSSKGFDHDRFWSWVEHLSEKNVVLISEHEAPSEFECIWQQEVKRTIDNNKRVKAVEKLFEIRE